jgi:hypothetical protein
MGNVSYSVCGEAEKQLAECQRELAELRLEVVQAHHVRDVLLQRLAEARAALKGTDDISCFLTWDMWADKYAAALKAAREEK